MSILNAHCRLASCLLALFPVLALGQTTPPTSAVKTTTKTATQTTTHVHHPPIHRAATKAAVCPPAEPAPVLPPGIPPATGQVQTAFALRYIDIQPGAGDPVTPGEYITVHYTGWLASDGTKFDSSVDRGQPFSFQQGMHRVIPGWDQGFAGMRPGGKRRLFIPYQLAYGDDGRPPVIPPKSDLIFDIELISASTTPSVSGLPQ